MKIAIYCRVSTEEQNTDNQQRMCEEYCKRNNYEIYKIYKDVISGKSTNRPQFNELLKDMRDFKFDTILVTKLDRMGRSLQHLLSLFDEFQKKKVGFMAVTQNIETISPSGKLQMQIMGAFAEFERDMIRERTMAGLDRARAQGKKLGRPWKQTPPEKKQEVKSEIESNIEVKQMDV
jgi:DNA invertase Pin-like site-specific DNA recombinase